jgi:small multidrug resistance family-3 protein
MAEIHQSSNYPKLMRALLDQIIAHRAGLFAVLAAAAVLEAYGDSCFQAGLYRSSGVSRMLWFLGGAASLALYGLIVNTPRWDFGQLLGLYIVFFFLVAQILAKVRFHQTPSPPILVGGSLIVAGGLVITFWKG